ncbi:MAG: DUF1501 domain-containing protein [Actinomycetota bacterium]
MTDKPHVPDPAHGSHCSGCGPRTFASAQSNRRRMALSRRAFLHRALAAGLVTAGGAAVAGCGLGGLGSSSPGAATGPATSGSTRRGVNLDTAPESTGRLLSDAVDGRVLVIVDLFGGNDGLSTLVPYGTGRYYDLRPDLAIPEDRVLTVDETVGLHPSLARLHRRGVLAVEGVGPINGDLSHFDMAARWQRGDVDGENAHLRTGFLARLVDAVNDGSPLVGVSTTGSSPYLANAAGATLSLSDSNDLWMLREDGWEEMRVFREQLAAFAPGPVADGYARLIDLAERLDTDEEELDWEQPMIAQGGDLGHQLYLAAELIAADVGTRVVYAGTGDYDTHVDHLWRHTDNLAQVDAAVDGFLTRADELGFADRVVVATVSEFGRRVPENGSGLDHGSASTMLIAGASTETGVTGLVGERPSLGELDEDDNLRTTIGFDRYLASLAQEWLGVEAASVLAGAPEPLGLF